MNADPWICEICAQEFDNESDLLAHRFMSQCELDMLERIDAQSECSYCGTSKNKHLTGCPSDSARYVSGN